MKNEEKFYNALEDIFVGAKIEGEGGFINLLKIKEKYYGSILERFKQEVKQHPIIKDVFKEEFFNQLYTFFNRYFSESGSVYFTKSVNWQRVYERVYTDQKDVILFWKTHMLYYVKTDVLYKDVEIIIKDEKTTLDYCFYFDVSTLSLKPNNEKRVLLYELEKVKAKKYIFKVKYATHGRLTKIDEIVKSSKIPDYILTRAFKSFERQTKVDFFINKNAKAFLTEQLDLYLHQLLLEEHNVFDQERLTQIKTIKTFVLKIINFIAQFEDELVRIWEKPKFALRSNYVITLNYLTKDIIEQIMAHKHLPLQIKEWEELGIINDDFKIEDIKQGDNYLPIDTKYFKDLELQIIGVFDHLDKALDGRLIKADNYQALRTIQAKYREKVKTIYIDPPFNTGQDFNYIDNYQDSTWLTLMQDRLNLAFKTLKEDGSFWLHLDDNANNYGKELIKDKFNDITEIIFDTNATKDKEADLFGYKSFGDNFQLKHQTLFYARNKNNYTFNKLWKPNRNTTKLGLGWLDLIAVAMAEKPKKISDYQYFINVWENGKFVKKLIDLNQEKIFPVGDIWYDIFSFTQSEMRVSESFGFTSSQKPENLLRRIIQASTNEGDVVLDFFLGIGTTTAVAHKIKRKWLGIEMGDHFYELYHNEDGEKKLGVLGRMKWVLNGDQEMVLWRRRPHLSKDINWQGGGFFKYYALEQYEDTLRKVNYKTEQEEIFNEKDPFAEYIFFGDNKLADVLLVENKQVKLDFNQLYQEIDWAETISNLYGLPIKRIEKDYFILDENGADKKIRIDFKNMNQDEKLEFIQLVKPLLWWGE